MSRTEVFFDANVLLYIPSSHPTKAPRAYQLLEQGGAISVQVLDELAAVMRRKYKLRWPVIHQALDAIRQAALIVPSGLSTHELGLELAERYRFSVYDSMLLAAALQAGCTTFWSEDLHDGQVIERTLTIRNPFAQGPG